MKYISYCKTLETIKDFNLKEFMETNSNNELFLSTNYNMFFKFEDLKNYINDENINKLKFFEVKEKNLKT